MPTSVIIAGIVGFVLGAITNLAAGLMLGGMFALIMWAMTGFRMRTSESAPAAVQAPPESVTTLKRAKTPDISSLSPRDIGRALAISLNTSCTLDSISEAERSLAQAARIPIERYCLELLVLGGFAQYYAIFSFSRQSDVGKEVLAGYKEAWSNVEKSSPEGAALFELFVKRCPEYAKAAREDEETSREGLSISRLSLVFGGNIQSPNSTSAEAGSAAMLAMTHAYLDYLAHREWTVEVLREALHK